MIINRENKKEKNKGITIVALVVTIIVLLILAAVSIATLTGENGILTKARTAKEETEKATAVEKVKVEVMGSFDKNGNLNLDELKENLNKVEGIEGSVTEEDFPITVTVDGQQITVQKNGTVENQGNNPTTFNPETLTIGEATRANEYGKKVNEYNVKTDDITGIWRLYYQDNNYTYLITDKPTNNTYQPANYHEKYQTGADVSIIGRKLNPSISYLFDDTHKFASLSGMAWLTDTSVWSSYANSDAIFAIGSPTLELFAKSYNSTGKSIKMEIIAQDAGYSIYQYYGDSTSKINLTGNYGIYNTEDDKSYWIASPNYENGGISVGDNTFNPAPDYMAPNGPTREVRPIVSIPTSIFNSKYTLAEE